MGVYCKRLLAFIFLCTLALFFAFNYVMQQDSISESDWNKGRIPLTLANQMYRNCCRTLKLEPGCLEACRYDLSLKTVNFNIKF
uniref:Uncharacterized protein n=1 Tax=Romanomermis culicivorax TaxID=13658 RepID=A0A915IUX2_ROMCU